MQKMQKCSTNKVYTAFFLADSGPGVWYPKIIF